MKGIVLTQFIEMVESRHGYEMVDELLTESDLPSGGAYTALGTYSLSEMTALLGGLSRKTATPVAALLHDFGRHLFAAFLRRYGRFFEHTRNAFDFLEKVETCFHAEVRKLHSEADLLRFACRRTGADSLEVVCHSNRRMVHLAEGLLAACFEHFGEPARIRQEEVRDADGRRVRFFIER